MTCIKTVSYAVLINGKLGIIVNPSRGIRQGDPISPYLVLLCAEGLSGLLSTYEKEGQIKGIKVAYGCQPLNHLFFVDDSILFCRASLTEWKQIQSIMKKYEATFGQCINKQKTSILFSPNTSDAIKNQIKAIIGVIICHNLGIYLGLLAAVGKSKNKTFGPLKDWIWHRIHNWKNNYLTLAGKEILLKVAFRPYLVIQ